MKNLKTYIQHLNENVISNLNCDTIVNNILEKELDIKRIYNNVKNKNNIYSNICSEISIGDLPYTFDIFFEKDNNSIVENTDLLPIYIFDYNNTFRCFSIRDKEIINKIIDRFKSELIRTIKEDENKFFQYEVKLDFLKYEFPKLFAVGEWGLIG